jgi:hypothetical protein
MWLGQRSQARPQPADRTRTRGFELRRGDYLTDGKTLLRVVNTVQGVDCEPLVEIEDCRTLEVMLWPVQELMAHRLTHVVPSAG